MNSRDADASASRAPLEVLAVFTRLGLTSFGGPVAHLGYFHDEFVTRRRWLRAEEYADLVALCQFLPGPASSQVGIGVGLKRAGVWGALAAWVGFTLPSAALLIAFALGLHVVGDIEGAAWLRGLKIVAVAVVAHALWGMATKLTPDRARLTLAVAAAAAALVWPVAPVQVLVIVAGGVVGWRLFAGSSAQGEVQATPVLRRRIGAMLLALFAAALVVVPIAREATGSFEVAVVDAFYRTGSLVFGGGHVVLPLLQAEVVTPGWVDAGTFTAGYGAAQAVPGPLFTFAAFLGATMRAGAEGVALGALALVAVFVPSFLLVLGVLPYWDRLRALGGVQSALRGVNAAVVGILLAALYHPVWTSAILLPVDLALALAAFVALAFWRMPAWGVVLATALAAAAVGAIGGFT